ASSPSSDAPSARRIAAKPAFCRRRHQSRLANLFAQRRRTRPYLQKSAAGRSERNSGAERERVRRHLSMGPDFRLPFLPAETDRPDSPTSSNSSPLERADFEWIGNTTSFCGAPAPTATRYLLQFPLPSAACLADRARPC